MRALFSRSRVSDTARDMVTRSIGEIEWLIPEKDEGAPRRRGMRAPQAWYDLRTSRSVKYVPKGEGWALNGLRFFMDYKTLDAFSRLNEANLENWRKMYSLLNGGDDIYNGLPLGIRFMPAQHVPTLCEEFYRVRCSSPHDFSPKVLAEDANTDLLECDTFGEMGNGLLVPARIVRVIDGDTLVVNAILPLKSMLCRKNALGDFERIAVLRDLGKRGIFSRFRRKRIERDLPSLGVQIGLTLRLYGVNAAEKSTREGAEAVELLENYLKRDARGAGKDVPYHPIWVFIGGREKYGRVLANVYLDEGRRILVNSFLGDISQARGAVYAVPYYP